MRPITLVALFIVLLSAVLPYRRAGENGFVYDDIAIVQDNPRTQDLGHVSEIFQTEYWNDRNIPSRLYRPVTLVSYAMERTFFGPSPFHFHLTNVALHALVSGLVLLSCLSLLGTSAASVIASTAASVLFAVHPLHSEAVAGIVGRAELLAALFTLIAWRAVGVSGWLRFLAPLAAFLALCSKESAALVVPIVFLSPWLPAEGDWSPRRAASRGLRALLWLAPGLLTWAVLRAHALRSIPTPRVDAADNPMAAASLLERLATAFSVFLRYLQLHAWPVNLAPDYSPQAVRLVHFGSPGALIGMAIFIAGIVLCWRLLFARLDVGDEKRSLAFALGWFLLGVLVVGNFLIVIGTAMAERLVYLPGIGLFLGLAILLHQALTRFDRAESTARVTPVRAAVGVFVLALATVWSSASDARTQAWRSPRTLFTRAVIDQPRSFRVWNALGEIQMKEGDAASARVSFERSLSLLPEHVGTITNLLAAQLTMGDDAAAAATAETLQQARPTDPRPRWVLALLRARSGDLQGARTEGEQALSLDPNSRAAHYVLADIAARAGDDAAATRELGTAFGSGSDSTQVLREVGSTLVRLALWPEAARVYRRLYAKQSDWLTGNTLAWSLVNEARSRSAQHDVLLLEALSVAQSALAITPAPARKYVLDTLAAAQWEAGRRSEAVATMEKLRSEFPWEDAYLRKLESFRARLNES